MRRWSGVIGLATWAFLATLHSAVAANCPSNPFTLVNGQTADATQVMANFNNLLNCADNNLAHNGANSDITSLAGLTTPISVIQGGTGLATLTQNGLLVGAGTGTPTFTLPLTNGNLLQSVTGAWISTNVWPGQLPTKTQPVTSDLIIIADSTASSAAKTATINSLSAVVTPPATNLVRAWGLINSSGACVNCSAGVGLSKSGTGDYVVTTGITATSSNYAVELTVDTGGSSFTAFSCQTKTRTQTTFEMFCFNTANVALADTGFSFAVFSN